MTESRGLYGNYTILQGPRSLLHCTYDPDSREGVSPHYPESDSVHRDEFKKTSRGRPQGS